MSYFTLDTALRSATITEQLQRLRIGSRYNIVVIELSLLASVWHTFLYPLSEPGNSNSTSMYFNHSNIPCSFPRGAARLHITATSPREALAWFAYSERTICLLEPSPPPPLSVSQQHPGRGYDDAALHGKQSIDTFPSATQVIAASFTFCP